MTHNNSEKIKVEKDTQSKYHHGDLKESLIRAGLKLLVEAGPEKFSLRKVAALCNVSHAAPYKHFKSKDELINAISTFVYKKFEQSLNEIKCDDPYEKMISMGKQYVSFMVENYDYLRYLFFNNYGSITKSIIVEKDEIEKNDYKTFNLFRKAAEECMRYKKVNEKMYSQDVIAMWAMVHGLAIMIANNNFNYEGSYMELVESILRNNIKF
ncbi:MAG: TetR/AcrR family transcriptional regulator [Clostridium butyricum]|nr:TetR/AcrR family transcriptional regulator [Clostridium butyricum]